MQPLFDAVQHARYLDKWLLHSCTASHCKLDLDYLGMEAANPVWVIATPRKLTIKTDPPFNNLGFRQAAKIATVCQYLKRWRSTNSLSVCVASGDALCIRRWWCEGYIHSEFSNELRPPPLPLVNCLGFVIPGIAQVDEWVALFLLPHCCIMFTSIKFCILIHLKIFPLAWASLYFYLFIPYFAFPRLFSAMPAAILDVSMIHRIFRIFRIKWGICQWGRKSQRFQTLFKSFRDRTIMSVESSSSSSIAFKKDVSMFRAILFHYNYSSVFRNMWEFGTITNLVAFNIANILILHPFHPPNISFACERGSHFELRKHLVGYEAANIMSVSLPSHTCP